MGIFKSYKDKIPQTREQSVEIGMKEVEDIIARPERERQEQLAEQQIRESRIRDIFSRVLAIDPSLHCIEDVLRVDNERLFIHDRLNWRQPVQIALLNKVADCDDPALWRTEYGSYTPKLDMVDEEIKRFLEILGDSYENL